MIYVQAPKMTLLQKVILFILLAAFLTGAFFLTMALLPLILVFIAYLWYKFYKFKQKVKEAQEQMFNSTEYQENFGNFQNNFQGNFLHSEKFSEKFEEQNTTSQNNTDVYDISPDDYTIEDKK